MDGMPRILLKQAKAGFAVSISNFLTDAEWGRQKFIIASANSDRRNRTIEVREILS
jgi:hypothetical protein